MAIVLEAEGEVFVKFGTGEVVQVLTGPGSTLSWAWFTAANVKIRIHVEGMKSESFILAIDWSSLNSLSVSRLQNCCLQLPRWRKSHWKEILGTHSLSSVEYTHEGDSLMTGPKDQAFISQAEPVGCINRVAERISEIVFRSAILEAGQQHRAFAGFQVRSDYLVRGIEFPFCY